ncbi:di-trans,poly-cis-decaprenylcistransferase [bacterium]|nr:di-trans,poly-cis-decaprenylcistransferase [bacterium]
MIRAVPAQPESAVAELEAALRGDLMPQHVAVIMDGNGRWGKLHGMERLEGHHEAIKAVRATVTAAQDLKLPFLTLYCFSTENLNRPADEIHGLFELFMAVLDSQTEELHERQVRIIFNGRMDWLPDELAQKFHAAVELTKHNTGLTLNLCVMYSGRMEMMDAIRAAADAIASGELASRDLDEESFRRFLYQPEVPDPDLIIRTSGEQRISNFLLWQLAYSELVFTEVLWPDFSRADFLAALLTYQQRNRRFGAV